MRLNLGCYTVMFKGWLNIDALPLYDYATANGYQFRQWDLRNPIPFPDASVKAIVASHVVEHLEPNHAAALLRECRRLLVPRGVLRVAVPDMELLARQYIIRSLSVHDSHNAEAANLPLQGQKFWHLLTGGDHRSGWDSETLTDAATAAGFKSHAVNRAGESVSEVIRAETKDLFPEISLYVDMQA